MQVVWVFSYETMREIVWCSRTKQRRGLGALVRERGLASYETTQGGCSRTKQCGTWYETMVFSYETTQGGCSRTKRCRVGVLVRNNGVLVQNDADGVRPVSRVSERREECGFQTIWPYPREGNCVRFLENISRIPVSRVSERRGECGFYRQ